MRAFPIARLIFVALLALVVSACPGADDDDATEDIYEVPTGDDDVFVPEPGGDGWDCEYPYQCRPDLGCSDETCGECTAADQCQSLRGCRSGTCGFCTESAQCRTGESCFDGWCLPTEVPDWELSIAPSDLALMDADPYENVWVPATLTVGETVYSENVQVRYSGGSTRNFPKKSFRIHFPEDVEHPGFQRKIILRAEYNDPSGMRSFLAYETARRLTGLPTPRARYVNLTLNGENAGLMLEVERIGGRFLKINGRDRDRSMYEGKVTSEFGALMPSSGVQGYQALYEKTTGDPEDWSDLIGLIEDDLWSDYTISDPWGPTSSFATRQVLALDSYVKYLAMMALIQNQDHVTNNYYISWQDVPGVGDRWEVYPWDLDLTFGCKWDEDLNSSLCGAPVADGWWMDGILTEPLMAGPPNVCWCNLATHVVLWDPQIIVGYEQMLCDLVVGDWWTSRLPTLIGATAASIETRVHADPADRNPTPQTWDAARAELLQFLTDRREFLQGQLECEYD